MINAKTLSLLSSNLVSEPDNYMHSFRQNLYMYMSQKDITLSELSDQADIPISTLKTLMYGNAKDCYISTAVKLAYVFNVSVDELIGSGTIPAKTCESLQLMRTLPDSFKHFIRWIIHFHKDTLFSNPVKEKMVEIMYVDTCERGNLKLSSHLDVVDISDFDPSIRTKIFMGVVIPSNSYEPTYFEGDTLFIANDRAPRENENVLICISNNIWIVRARKEHKSETDKEVITRYYGIRDNRPFADENMVQAVMGYVVKVERG